MLRAGKCILHSRTFEKIVSAECRNQHALSVRSPEYANTREAILRVFGGIVRVRIRG
jgi:hypothetical protein